MFSPLLQSIIEREKWAVVDHESLDELARGNLFSVLLFAGDAGRLAESNDVAVILPELVKTFDNLLVPLVVSRDSERELQRRYRFNAFPTLVFLKEGGYLGAIPRVLDWQDYVHEIAAILTREASDPPPFEFPEGCGAPKPDSVNNWQLH
ncbi:MAG: hydrogenase-1 expression HyaE [Nitratireductor sp.]|nr:hydrogenase-1 expression HyaE [Nitratireductor sp.]